MDDDPAAGASITMRLLVIFLVLAALFTIPFLIWGSGFELKFSQEGARDWIESFGPWGWAAGVGLLVGDLVLPVPATAVISALGFVYGPVLGGLVGATGSFLAGALAYGLCRCLGRRVAVWICGEADLVRGERFIERVGPWAVAISRWMPLLPEVMTCLAGLVRMRARVFVIALACGSAPMAFTFAFVGAAGEERPVFALALSAGLPVILWPLARWLLNRPLRSRHASEHRAEARRRETR